MSWFDPNPPRRPSSRTHSHHNGTHQSSSNDRGYFYTASSSSRGTGRARPRDGFINRMVYQIRRYLRRLYDYARRHPVKLLMMILPLLTGGALAGVLAKFGIRLPAGLDKIIGGAAGRHGGGGFGGLGKMGSQFGGPGGGGVEGFMKIAKMFV